jgi:hypothetical protein
MKNLLKVALAIFISILTLSGIGATILPVHAGTPLWVQHVQNYSGGISNTVRAYLDPAVIQARSSSAFTDTTAPTVTLNNVQMNNEPTPDLPQDETQVALNPSNPLVAVAAANDFVTGGLWIGHTTDGGKTWSNFRAAPTASTGRTCDGGGDPAVAFSVRDNAFYVAQLCFFFTNPISEVQLWKSTDNGVTWTKTAKGSTVFTNIVNGSVDGTLFYDKDLLAIDNNPSSPHFGRLYVTSIKFHFIDSLGFGDFCPVQVAFTDKVPTSNPRSATWTHVAVVPDLPLNGVGVSANQWALPVVDNQGGLDIAYAIESCNTGHDFAMFIQRSTDGGNIFTAPVQINFPTEFLDNPNPFDLLPDKNFRAPLSPSLAFNPVTKALEFVYQNNVNMTVSGADISFQQSKDYGATWSHAKTISITPSGAPAPNDQFEPWIAVDEKGNLHAIWYDNRNDPGNKLIQTFQAFSSNDGATWVNFNISTTAWNPDNSFFSCGCFIGDYTGLAASTTAIYPVWTDGRNSPGPPNGDTEIFTNLEIGGIQ